MKEQKDNGLFFKPNSDRRGTACLNIRKADFLAYILGYKQAADFLVEKVIQEDRYQDTLVYPIAFLYRQYIELRLKHLIPIGCFLLDKEPQDKPPVHGILGLWREYRDILEAIHPGSDTDLMIKVEKYIKEFDQVDNRSTAFRYPTDKKGKISLGKMKIINLRNLYDRMGEVALLLDGAAEELNLIFQYKCDEAEYIKLLSEEP